MSPLQVRSYWMVDSARSVDFFDLLTASELHNKMSDLALEHTPAQSKAVQEDAWKLEPVTWGSSEVSSACRGQSAPR